MMVQNTPGDGPNPIVNPFFVKEGLDEVVATPKEEGKTEAEKESETTPEDFISFGDPDKLKRVKEETKAPDNE